jgi:hypothetical protein
MYDYFLIRQKELTLLGKPCGAGSGGGKITGSDAFRLLSGLTTT